MNKLTRYTIATMMTIEYYSRAFWQWLKRLNWNGFLFMMVISIIASLGNPNWKDYQEALIVGIGLGFIFGIPLMLLTRKPK